ncbi:Pimeloyl-ACP methyl ester carboxylesterase [Dyadobacter koreensis]|uniref:Pimeloyl-ACP methyl ester carboxylesterase n=1 Tax=Dyadobacter koreensis TaxID=408657 RepID=A0A1H6Q5L9_9BACT|nr:alpha/beta fold hydrolase [Dyadobacter koreensis]SEI39109.1 Pimeloyl-ACP methyl ester carboxylesterase [Dyadobacter koreensis]
MKIIIMALANLLLITSCKNKNDATPIFTETKVSLTTHKLATFSATKSTKYLVVFESGLGDDHTVWNNKAVASQVNSNVDVLMYDRAGYGQSENGPTPRNIDRLRSELESVIDKFSNGRKVILIGHSLGGTIIRDYAIKNPLKTAALLFVDPSHEFYNHPTQAEEDMLYDASKNANGANFGGTQEAREFIEDLQYTSALPSLPNVPVIVLTSMRTDATHSSSVMQTWYNAHELLKNGVSDFTHIATTNSGHYIMIDEPALVIDNFKLLISKLP